MTNIIIVDDHELIRQGLKKILAQQPDMHVVGEAKSGDGLLELIRKQNPNVVILDITLPGKSGLEILEEIALHYPKVKVLILSMHPEERFALRVLRAGASGYLTKESVGSDIVAAIRKVTSGRKYVSDSLLTDLVDELDHRRSKSLHDRLSNREYEIFLKIAAGKSTSQIAEALSLSINTIATYRSRILEKMKLKSNVELVRYAIEKKLLD